MAPWHVDPGPPGDPKGRRVIADKRFRPGDVVLRDQPYAAVLYDDQVARRCDCCLEAADNLLRWAHACTACQMRGPWPPLPSTPPSRLLLAVTN